MTQPRVRIAPSPTGNLHVGTARTALFNYIFAKKNSGKFILRIEDTDLERSQNSYEQNIYDSLKALGLSWDEGPGVDGKYGPYKQSERFDLYSKKAEELINNGHAYYCYCSQEELEQEKEIARQQKSDFIYNRKCLEISEEKKQQYINEGRKPTIRFKVPHKELTFNDLIRNEVKFDTSLTGDFVIMKSDNTPTYNFAVVIDDIGMDITHVIRGEDHISNTPKQILLYEALNCKVPEFAHVGMILATDKSKLSKRHGATAVSEFVEQGYLPEAFVNFMALLGWSPPDGEEIKSLDEIIKLFELDKISHAGAVFDKEKLNWINGLYIRSLPLEDITERCKKYLKNYDLSKYSDEKLKTIISELRERITILSEVTEAAACFFNDAITFSDEVKENALTGDHVKDVLKKFLELTEQLDFNNSEDIEEKFKEFRKSMKPLKPKFIMMPVRATLTGQLHGADLSSIIYILGKDNVVSRINKYLNTL
ncbi:MAG: glutamate--tRNA ligase [Cyanobacteriota bacterium]